MQVEDGWLEDCSILNGDSHLLGGVSQLITVRRLLFGTFKSKPAVL